MNRIDDYLFTLELCRKALPPETEHIHYERLRDIERIVRRSLARRAARRQAAEVEVRDQGYGNDSLGG